MQGKDCRTGLEPQGSPFFVFVAGPQREAIQKTAEARATAKTNGDAMKANAKKERAIETNAKKAIKAKTEAKSAVKATAKTCKPAMRAKACAVKTTAKTCKLAMKAKAKAKTAITMMNKID